MQKRILIVGAGVVGYSLARQLSLENHAITVIEQNTDRVAEVARLDCAVVAGSGAYPSVLLQADLQSTDIVVAVTDNDSVNVMICLLAAQLVAGHPQRRIARVRNPEYATGLAAPPGAVAASGLSSRQPRLFAVADGAKDTPLTQSTTLRPAIMDYMINPDLIIVDTICRFLDSPGATEVADFASGRIQLRRFAIPAGCALDGIKVMELARYTKLEPFLLAAIIRENETRIPVGGDEIQAGDEVVFVMPEGVQPFVLQLIDRPLSAARKVIVNGASPQGAKLAERLEERVNEVLLLEADRERAEAVSERLKRTRVMEGKATDIAVLRDIGIDTADDFVSVGTDDSMNLMASLLAKHLGAKQTIMLVHEIEYLPVLTRIGVDVAVNARLLTIGSILRYVRGENVISVAKFAGDAAEAIELIAEENTRLVGTKLADMKLKGLLIGAIQRGDETIMPRGGTVVEPGDHVTLLALTDSLGNLEKLTGRKRRFVF